MTTQLATELHDKIQIADTLEKPKESLYMLWYRENSNPHPMTKYFFHKGDFRSAIERGRKHCETVGQRFIHVRPFLTDLDAEEKRIRGNID